MPRAALSQQFIDVMERMHKIMGTKKICNEIFSITPLQLFAIEYLHNHPASTVGNLGEYLNISSSAVAQLTNRLVNLKLIRRHKNKEDRRIVLLTLTNKGEKLYAKFHAHKMQQTNMIMTHMPEKDVRSLIKIFNNLLNAIEKNNS